MTKRRSILAAENGPKTGRRKLNGRYGDCPDCGHKGVLDMQNGICQNPDCDQIPF